MSGDQILLLGRKMHQMLGVCPGAGGWGDVEAGRWNVNIRSFKYVSSFFWMLIQEDNSSMNINIQVAIG